MHKVISHIPAQIVVEEGLIDLGVYILMKQPRHVNEPFASFTSVIACLHNHPAHTNIVFVGFVLQILGHVHTP